MPGEKTLAIVLKTQDYRDTSLLVSFLTPGFGKVRALVKGGRDARVKLGSTLEPFSLNEVLLYRRRRGDLHLATSAELIELYPRLREDCDRLAAATLCCEWVEQLVEGGAHPEIFEALRETLGAMNAPPHAVSAGVSRFAIRLLTLLGLMPVLDRCVHCGVAGEGGFKLFSVKSGGVVCDRCRHREESMIRMDDRAVCSLQDLCRSGFGTLGDGGSARELLERFIDFHLQYPPHSRRFLDKILQFERKHTMESECTFKTSSPR